MRESDQDVIIIDEYEPVPAEKPPARPQKRALRWPSRAMGLAATVAVHFLMCTPLFLGVAATKKRETPDGTGATAWASQGEQVEAMILLDLSSMSTSADFEMPQMDSEDAIELKEEDLQLVSVDPTPPADVTIEEEEDAEEADEATVAAGDPRGRAELFGKYMGHVGARIDRAWMRPRAPIEGQRFDCRARVMQDRQGFVLSVSLDDSCGSDAKWRASLTSAILRASPLSAPPEPWLFTEALTLQFSAEQYEAGRTPEYLYEPAPVQVAMHTPGAAPSASSASPAAAKPETGDLELTITGSQVEWKKR